MRSDYIRLPAYYDHLIGEVDYGALAEYLMNILQRFGCRPQILLDLCCGTGSLLSQLAGRGMELIGVDASPEMLDLAAGKFEALPLEQRPLLLCQDMRELDLYGTIDAAFCTLDSVNSLRRPGDVIAAFSRVSLFLNPGGIFVFDVNSPYKFREIIANNVFVYDTDEVYCIWQNEFHEKSGLCRFLMTYFTQNGAHYERSDEIITERVYSRRQLEGYLRKAGLQVLAVYGDQSDAQPGPQEQRLYFVARKEEQRD